MVDAEYLGSGCGNIRISPTVWSELDTYKQYELIIHEVCHIITDYHDAESRYCFHGREWKIFMKCAGLYKPKALIHY